MKSENARRNSALLILVAVLVALIFVSALVVSEPAHALDQEYDALDTDYYVIYYPENYQEIGTFYQSNPSSEDKGDYFRLYLKEEYKSYTTVTYTDGDNYLRVITAEKGTNQNGVDFWYINLCYNVNYKIAVSNGTDTYVVTQKLDCFDFIAPRVNRTYTSPKDLSVRIEDPSSDGRNQSVQGLKSVTIYTAEKVFYHNDDLGGVGTFDVPLKEHKDGEFLSDVYIRIEDLVGHVTEEKLWEKIATTEYERYMGLKHTLNTYIEYKDEDGMGLSDNLIARLNLALAELETTYATQGVVTFSAESLSAISLANQYVNEGMTLDEALTVDVEEGITLPTTSAKYYYKDIKYGDQAVLTITSTDTQNTLDPKLGARIKTYTVTFTVNGVERPFSNGVSIYCAFDGASEVTHVFLGSTPLSTAQSTTSSIRFTLTGSGVYTVYYGAVPSTPWWVWLLVALGSAMIALTALTLIVVLVVIPKRRQK